VGSGVEVRVGSSGAGVKVFVKVGVTLGGGPRADSVDVGPRVGVRLGKTCRAVGVAEAGGSARAVSVRRALACTVWAMKVGKTSGGSGVVWAEGGAQPASKKTNRLAKKNWQTSREPVRIFRSGFESENTPQRQA
jgi:hypothetical protein